MASANTMQRMEFSVKALLALACAALVGLVLAVGALAVQPQEAYAASLAPGTLKVTTIKDRANADAAIIIKAAKATKGTNKEKLKKIFTRIAKDKKYKGAYTYGDYHGYYYFKAQGTANAKYYPAKPPVNMKDYYLKYTIDAYNTKQASCYHYASLFAVCAKKALGNKATVKIAIGGTNVTGSWNAHHAWVEVTLGKTAYLYDPMNGNYWSLNKSKTATGFGRFCGCQKASVKSYYKGYRGAKYCIVTL